MCLSVINLPDRRAKKIKGRREGERGGRERERGREDREVAWQQTDSYKSLSACPTHSFLPLSSILWW